MIFAAVDPGAVNAAVAVFSDGVPLLVDDIKTANGMLDPIGFAGVLRAMRVEQIVVENVHSMPGQGVSSTFKFGMGTGIIYGVTGALRLPLTLVTPTKWKGFHRLNADKEAARAMAIRKWPEHNQRLERKKDVNRAEALLIGQWFWACCVAPRIPDPFT